MHSPTKGLMSEEELERLAVQQVVLERVGSLRVKSVEKQTQSPETTQFYVSINNLLQWCFITN